MTESLRERKKLATRRAISDAATALFMAKGFDHTAITEIADVVGVSSQTVLNYFPTKTDLFFDDNTWYAGPPRAVRDGCPLLAPCAAVRDWYLTDLHRRHGEGHLNRLVVYLQTISDSDTLRRRRLDDLAALTTSLQTALKDIYREQAFWETALGAATLTSAIMVAETETARLSQSLAGTRLLNAAQAAASSIFERTTCTSKRAD